MVNTGDLRPGLLPGAVRRLSTHHAKFTKEKKNTRSGLKNILNRWFPTETMCAPPKKKKKKKKGSEETKIQEQIARYKQTDIPSTPFVSPS